MFCVCFQVMLVGDVKGQKVQDVKKAVQKQMVEHVSLKGCSFKCCQRCIPAYILCCYFCLYFDIYCKFYHIELQVLVREVSTSSV